MPPRKIHTNRRDDLIRAAAELFETRGYEKTTIAAIAQKAGYSKGSFYLEFEDKDDLLAQLVKTRATHQLGWMKNVVSCSQKDHLESLKNMLVQSIVFIYDRVVQDKHSANVMERNNERIRNALCEISKTQEDMVSELLKKATEAGEIPIQSDYGRVAYLIFSSIAVFTPPYTQRVASRINTPLTREELQQDVASILDYVIAGLKQIKHT